MKIDLFLKTLRHLQGQFNELFGKDPTKNIDERQTLILAICWLGVLQKRISASKNPEEAKEMIAEFNRGSNLITNYLKQKEEKPCMSNGSAPIAENISAAKR